MNPENITTPKAPSTRMNPEIKARWVEALRSGKYEQGTAHLAREDGDGKMVHCCLGVLSELAVEDGIAVKRPHREGQSVTLFVDTEGRTGTALLSIGVADWAGLSSNSPIVKTPDSGLQHLTGLNDTGVSFAKIADIIEVSL